MENAVLNLRQQRLADATRPFRARGNRIQRCQRCLLPMRLCLCDTLAPQTARSQFCLLMSAREPLKPSNTGRLIADILPETQAFLWARTAPPPALLHQLRTTSRTPFIVFPADSVSSPGRQIFTRCPPACTPLFILPDGTWRETRRMFRQSHWLNHLPVLSLDLPQRSAYGLRVSADEACHCTAEIAIVLLRQMQDNAAAQVLENHFRRFRQRYLSVKSHSRTQTDTFVSADGSQRNATKPL